MIPTRYLIGWVIVWIDLYIVSVANAKITMSIVASIRIHMTRISRARVRITLSILKTRSFRLNFREITLVFHNRSISFSFMTAFKSCFTLCCVFIKLSLLKNPERFWYCRLALHLLRENIGNYSEQAIRSVSDPHLICFPLAQDYWMASKHNHQ